MPVDAQSYNADQGVDFVSKLRYDVLCDGTALSHFHSALFGRNERIRKQSRFMFSLWMDDFSEGLSVLCNILPDIFYNILTERSTGPTSVPLPGEGMATDLSPKWERFFLALQHDHYHAKLVWNESCRKELRVRLENEIMSLEKGRATSIHILMKSNDDSTTVNSGTAMSQKGVGGDSIFGTTVREKRKHQYITWNYKEFKINYKAHRDAVKIGHFFLAPMLGLRHSVTEFPIEKLEAPYLFHMIHNSILKEIVKNVQDKYVENKSLGTLLSILDVLVAFHHDALEAMRVGVALNTLGLLISSLSKHFMVAEIGKAYNEHGLDGNETNNGGATSLQSSDHLCGIVSKSLCAIQTLGNHFPYEIDNFIESKGVHACVRILRLTPGAKAGSPRSMVASLTLETLRGLCASHSVLNPKNNASVWPLPNIHDEYCVSGHFSPL